MLSSAMIKAYVKTTQQIRVFINNKDGLTAIEYGLIIICVGIFIIAVYYSKSGFMSI